jgi:outer membrane murein-binding lipoprotein Lpp
MSLGRTALVGAAIVGVVSLAGCTSAKPAAGPSTAVPRLAASPVATPSARSSAIASSGTATTPAAPSAPRNLTLTPAVKAQLVAAFVAAKKINADEVTGETPGSGYYAYLPATRTYWALAGFTLSSKASYQTQVDTQDGGGHFLFSRRAGEPWTGSATGIPWPCPGQLDPALSRLWNLPYLAGCTVVDGATADRFTLQRGAQVPTVDSGNNLLDGTYRGRAFALTLRLDNSGDMELADVVPPGAAAAEGWAEFSFEESAAVSSGHPDQAWARALVARFGTGPVPVTVAVTNGLATSITVG